MKMSRPIREQIDACRPGSDDLALPELAELAAAVEQDGALAAELARSQRFDQAVSVAMHELPVPAGLMERILAAAEANKPTPAPPAQTAPARGWSRRRWLALAGSLAVLVLVAVTAWQFFRGPARTVTREELSLAVANWDEAVLVNAWKVKKPMPVVVPAGIGVPAPARWQTVSTPSQWSASAVAIDLVPPKAIKSRAILVVVSSRATFKVNSTPTALTLSRLAGTVQAVAWQSPTTKVLYVLIVHTEDGQGLRDFLRLPSEV